MIICFFTIVSANEFYEGENLITPYELDETEWEVLKKEEGSFRSVMWRSKESGMADSYVVNVQGGNQSKLKRVRKIQDDPGKKSCKSFESIDLEPIKNNSYKSIMWRTVCQKADGFKAQMLHLVIKGKDSIYHLQKIWLGEVADSEIEEWIATFRDVYVCDTRQDEKQCPTGYQKVENA